MVVRTRTVWKLKRGIYEAWEGGEAEVSDDDTVTVDSLSGTAAAIYRAAFWKMADGTVVAVTYVEASPNTNRITIDAPLLTNCKCIYMVYGVKA